WDGTSFAKLSQFYAYDPRFTGGVRVAAGDVDGDHHADVITGAGPGGGPHVRVYSGADHHLITQYYAYDATYTGRVYVAAGDGTGDCPFARSGAGQHDGPGDDQAAAGPVLPGESFAQEQGRQGDGDHDAELVHGGDLGCLTELEGAEVAQPRRPGGQAR